MPRSRRKPGSAAPPPTQLFSFRVTPELRARLEAAAGDRPLGEFVREKLEWALSPAGSTEKSDPCTEAVIDGIRTAVARMARHDHEAVAEGAPRVGHWTESKDAYRVFEFAVRRIAADMAMVVAVIKPEEIDPSNPPPRLSGEVAAMAGEAYSAGLTMILSAVLNLSAVRSQIEATRQRGRE